MRFSFPIVIIDEDYRSENTSGTGIRALASALEEEGMDVVGFTSYGDLTSFAQQQSRAAGVHIRQIGFGLVDRASSQLGG